MKKTVSNMLKTWLALGAALGLILCNSPWAESKAAPTEGATNLTFTIGQTSGPAGTEVVVPVQVTQFTNINSFQFSLHWSAAVAGLVRIEQFGLTGLTEGNFATNQANNGTITVSWDDPSAQSKSLGDGATLFAVRLRLHGAVGATSAVWIDGTPTSMEAADELLNILPITILPGQITITPGNTPTLTFILGQTNGPVGAEVVVPVQVTQFTNINSFQFSLHWTGAVAAFVAVEQFGLSTLTEGNFATNQAASGTLTVSWDDVSGQSKTLADGTTLFAVRLGLQGTVGAASTVWIDGTPTAMEAINGAIQEVGMAVVPGQVRIRGNAPVLTFTSGQTNGLAGSEVVVPVQVTQFTNINLFQFSLHWPPGAATFAGLEQIGLATLSEGNFATNQAASGTLTVSWDDVSGQSKSLADGTTLFAVRLRLHGTIGNPDPVWIDGTPTLMEAFDWEMEPVLMAIIPGQVTTDSAPLLTAQAQDQTLCLGATVEVSVEAIGSPPLSFQWRRNGSDLDDNGHYSGARSKKLKLANAESTDADSYSVVISNAYGVLTSTPPATLALNMAPVLGAIQNATIPDGQLFTFTASATNLDASPQTLTFSLKDDALPGASIDPATGVFTWTPDEVNGPGTYPLAVVVSDDCTPSLTATQAFTLTVIEGNSRPVFTPIGNLVAYVLKPIHVTNVVTDADWPANRLTYQLGPGGPSKFSRVDTNTGVYSYWPKQADARRTYWITIIATDSGQPPRSATNQFSIFVDDYVELSLGKTVLRTGTTGSVPITFAASSGVTNLTATLVVSNHWLTDLAVTNMPPVLQSANVIQEGPDVWQLVLCAKPGQKIEGGMSPGDLQFTVRSTSSAFVPLVLSNITALRLNGAPVPRTLANSGRVVVVNSEPLLEALVTTNNQRVLILYAEPGQENTLLSTPGLGPTNLWQGASPGSITNLYQVIQPTALSNQTIFLRGVH